MSMPTYGIPTVIISNSGAVTSSNTTTNLRTANPSLGWRPIPASECVTLVLDVTANSGTGGPNTAFVQIDHSPDGGTTWFCAFRFTQVTTSTATIMITARTNGTGANEAAVNAGVVSSISAAVVNNFVLSPDHRVRWALATGQSLTFGLYAFSQPAGSRVSY